MRSDFFHRLSIASKLNLILLLAVVLVFGAAGVVISALLEGRSSERWIQNLRQINQQVIYMTEAYASALEGAAEIVGAQFTASLPSDIRIDSDREYISGAMTAPELSYGETVLNNDFELADRFTANTAAVATIFVRKGDDLVRISTSLKKENGERAIGTMLDRQHPAWGALMNGQGYTGRAFLFGNDYMTRYLPLKDDSGRLIGATFIGINFTEGLKSLKQKIESIRVGKTGYVFVLETGAEAGKAIIHPRQEGQNLFETKDPAGRSVIRDMVEQKSGVFQYEWPGDRGGFGKKFAVAQTFDPWDWLVVTDIDADEIAAETGTVRVLFLTTGALVVIVLALCIFFSTRVWVSAPLRRAVEITRRVAAGDLAVHIETNNRDEVGKLFEATAEMCANLRAMIGGINTNIDNLLNEAHALATASVHATRIAGDQSASATAMASAIQEVAASIEEVSAHAHDTKAVAERFGAISDNGVETVGKAITSMGEIAATVREASDAVTLLGEQSEQISSIVGVIQEIAAQTNLLALNAAIEAARAGELGRGFAVVADEVRKLAERTTTATKEIGDTIVTIQKRARNAVEQMGGGLVKVEEGVELANEAGSRIAEIRQNTSLVGDAIAGISLALDEQATVNQDVSNNVEKIAGQAELNHRQAENTSSTADNLKKMAENLRESVSRFQC